MGTRSTLTSWADDDWPEYAPDEVLPRLFQGGTHDDEVVGQPAPPDHYGQLHRGSAAREHPFDLVVTLYADAQPAPWGVREYRYGFVDGPLATQDARQVIELARLAYAAWAGGERVLVRCQAGVNRSGLVTTLILMLAGYQAGEAIALLRSRRSPMVLCNEDFESWLRNCAESHISPECGVAA